MARVCSLFLVTLTIIAKWGEVGGSSSNPQPCCLPQQFTALATEEHRRNWARVTYDFINRRKVVHFVGSDGFVYMDMQNKLAYERFNSSCEIHNSHEISVLPACIPADAQLDTYAGHVVGQGLVTNTWKIDADGTSIVLTVSDEKCYPISASFKDLETGATYFLYFTNVEEEIDPEDFSVDLSNCTPV